MDSTEQFVADVQEKQRKNKRNKQRHGEGNPGEKLPGKQHSTNK
ncbi:MAG: DUF4023 family protein [Candidatus Cohnella colombiensis]|uniref:DUF4023 family protein n=1 Tax=Candidatus Cohnella colombiensis TaxID=3121368 RepID=A0AA95EWB0_9BACL|nr:MAG: DUF4023 family protein [Cohnella sp.]